MTARGIAAFIRVPPGPLNHAMTREQRRREKKCWKKELGSKALFSGRPWPTSGGRFAGGVKWTYGSLEITSDDGGKSAAAKEQVGGRRDEPFHGQAPVKVTTNYKGHKGSTETASRATLNPTRIIESSPAG